MSAPSRLLALAGEDRGAVLVTFALFAPVVLLLAAFAIDGRNFFLHKRHLQVQADAAAFAAVKEFQPCNNANIYARAGQYGGVSETTTPSGSATSATPIRNQQ